MGFYYDKSIGDTSEQAFDVDEARKLMAAAGYPGGKGFPALEMICTPGTKRDGEVVANILKKSLGITVKVVPPSASQGPVLMTLQAVK